MAKENISIKSISIKNYKSIIDTTIQLGGFNLFIGANGCGKSNILEAIALGAAASANKCDLEYFANRGIRITNHNLMLPMFNNEKKQTIDISIIDSNNKYSSFSISYNNSSSKWNVQKGSDLDSEIKQKIVNKEFTIRDLLTSLMSDKFNDNKIFQKYKDIIASVDFKIPSTEGEHSHDSGMVMTIMPKSNLKDFLIFSLDESKLRKSDASKIFPLGNHGEGLFAYLKDDVSKRETASDFFNELKDNLMVFDWFEEIEIPNGQLSNEFNIQLKDSYLYETLNTFDQRSTNEGFLYLLFYLTLIISDKTPKFFAIENIDSSFNPKLCREIIKRLIVLAKRYGKQIIATTHNPAVLDGLDLEDNDVRLYTVFRTVDGDTKADRVELKHKLTIPLSEAWQRGYIGGLPNNF